MYLGTIKRKEMVESVIENANKILKKVDAGCPQYCFWMGIKMGINSIVLEPELASKAILMYLVEEGNNEIEKLY